MQFALALSDGLTSSFWSERAAVLACWVAMGVLVDRKATLAPEELARSSFDAAGRAIGQFVDDLRRDPEAARPRDQPYASTWRFMLERGRLMQTTLMLAWVAREDFHLAIVGDGGALGVIMLRRDQAGRGPTGSWPSAIPRPNKSRPSAQIPPDSSPGIAGSACRSPGRSCVPCSPTASVVAWVTLRAVSSMIWRDPIAARLIIPLASSSSVRSPNAPPIFKTT